MTWGSVTESYITLRLKKMACNCTPSKIKTVPSVSTVNIGAKPAKVTKYSINYNCIWILLDIRGYISYMPSSSVYQLLLTSQCNLLSLRIPLQNRFFQSCLFCQTIEMIGQPSLSYSVLWILDLLSDHLHMQFVMLSITYSQSSTYTSFPIIHSYILHRVCTCLSIIMLLFVHPLSIMDQ